MLQAVSLGLEFDHLVKDRLVSESLAGLIEEEVTEKTLSSQKLLATKMSLFFHQHAVDKSKSFIIKRPVNYIRANIEQIKGGRNCYRRTPSQPWPSTRHDIFQDFSQGLKTLPKALCRQTLQQGERIGKRSPNDWNKVQELVDLSLEAANIKKDISKRIHFGMQNHITKGKPREQFRDSFFESSKLRQIISFHNESEVIDCAKKLKHRQVYRYEATTEKKRRVKWNRQLEKFKGHELFRLKQKLGLTEDYRSKTDEASTNILPRLASRNMKGNLEFVNKMASIRESNAALMAEFVDLLK